MLKPNSLLRMIWVLAFASLCACQSAPFGRGEDPNIAVTQAMDVLQKQAFPEITTPTEEERLIVQSVLTDLAFAEDALLYPLIRLLKEGKMELLASDSLRMAQNPELSRDKANLPLIQRMKLIAWAIRLYLDPIHANQALNSASENPHNPPAWKKLAQLVSLRLNALANQTLILRKKLLNAEVQSNPEEQIRILEDLVKITAPQGMGTKVADGRTLIFYLNRLQTLQPQPSPQNLQRWEWLGDLYREQNNSALAKDAYQQALAVAQAMVDAKAIERLQKTLGIIPINPNWVRFYQQTQERIRDINRAMSQSAQAPNAENLLVIADLYLQIGQSANADNTVNQALALARQEKNTRAEVGAIILLGDLARLHSDLRRAQSQYSLAQNLLPLADPQSSELKLLLMIKVGEMLFYQGAIPSALEQMQLAQNTAQSLASVPYSARIQAELWVMRAMQSKQFNTLSPEWSGINNVLRQLADSQSEQEVQSLAGVVLAGLGQHREALLVYERAMTLAENAQRYFRQAQLQVNYALSLQRLGRKEEAIAELKKAELLLKTLQSDMVEPVSTLLEAAQH